MVGRCLTNLQQERVQGLGDDRCAADVIKVSRAGDSVYMQHEKQNAFTRMLDCETYLHLIEKAILKTICVEILVVP